MNRANNVVAGCIAIVAGATACGQVLGVSDYSVAPPEVTSTGRPDASAEMPIVPAHLSPPIASTCEKCMLQNCVPERNACVASARCRALLSCEAACSDPNCLANCAADYPPSLAFDDYFGCAFGTTYGKPQSKCPSECAAGQDWDCVGKYDWNGDPTKGTAQFADVRLNDIGVSNQISSLEGSTIARCTDSVLNTLSGDAGCGNPVTLDAHNLAHVSLGGNDVFALGTPEKYRIYPPPIVRSGPVVLTLLSRGLVDPSLPGIEGFDRSLGTIGFVQFDCLGVSGSANIELTAPGATTQRYFWTGFAVLDSKADNGAFGGFINVPFAKQVGIKSSGPEGPRSRATVMVAPGWITDVLFYPLTTRDVGG
jgi:hypothetical protein